MQQTLTPPIGWVIEYQGDTFTITSPSGLVIEYLNVQVSAAPTTHKETR